MEQKFWSILYATFLFYKLQKYRITVTEARDRNAQLQVKNYPTQISPSLPPFPFSQSEECLTRDRVLLDLGDALTQF